jgi:hypothetical protein
MDAAQLSRRGFLAGAAAGALAGHAAGASCRADASAGPRREIPSRTVTVGKGKYRGTTNAVLQQAVDDVAKAGGGTVIVPAGVYEMRDALHLRSGVRVVGGRAAILRKAPSVESRIPAYLGYGHYEIIVAEPDKFPVGTGVHILDGGSGGFYTTVATVIGRDGDRLLINRMLNHDYHSRNNARAVSVFALVEAEGVHDAAIEGLTIDGQAERQSMVLNGCRGGGVFLIGSRRVAVRRVEVRGYRGDAISFQQCADILVEGCHIHDNTGTGLHPGSGSVRYVMQDNRVHDNGGCGVFYCLRTTHSICRRNELRANGRQGISIGERDTDHLIEANKIVANGAEGVLWRGFTYRGGDRVVLRTNQIGPNGAKGKRSEVALAGGLRDVHVLDNALAPGQGGAVHVGAGCQRVSIAGNRIAGQAQRRDDVAGAGSGVGLARPKQLPKVGPAALPLDGARHLAVERLDAWDERSMWPA